MLATTNGKQEVENKLVKFAPKDQNVLVIKTIDDLSRLSQMLAASNFFADAKDAAQCGVKVLAGLEMGIGAFQSMTGIHIIKGKPSVGAGLIAAKIKNSGKYDFEVLDHNESLCSLLFYETEFKADIKSLKRQMLIGHLNKETYQDRLKTVALGISTFTIQDARKAGTQNIEKFARNMLFARAISNGQKWYCPDVFSCSVYTPEELGANVDDDGNLIYTPEPPHQSTFATTQEDPQEKKALSDKILSILDVKKLDRVFAVKALRERYSGKNSRDQLTLAELRDFVSFLEAYQAPTKHQEPTIDASFVDVPDEEDIPFN